MQAIILAGGFGTRLNSITHAKTSKPMALIGSKPFLAYLIEYLIANGITRIVFSLYFLYQQIQSYFRNHYQGVAIDYVVEENPLGTGGAIVNVLKTMGIRQPVFIINGDSFLALDYEHMWRHHAENHSALTLALKFMTDCHRYSVIRLHKNHIVDFLLCGDDRSCGLINAGIYLLNPDLITSFSLPQQFSFEAEFLALELQKIRPHAFITQGYFIDIGVPQDYERALRELPDQRKVL